MNSSSEKFVDRGLFQRKKTEGPEEEERRAKKQNKTDRATTKQ